MRHEKSIAAAYGFLSGLGASVSDFTAIVMDRKEQSDTDFDTAKALLLKTIEDKTPDALIMATKVNDRDDTSQLIPLLRELRDHHISSTPIILTHLSTLDDGVNKEVLATGLNITVVENDNLGFPKLSDGYGAVRTGMRKLGPAILTAIGQ